MKKKPTAPISAFSDDPSVQQRPGAVLQVPFSVVNVEGEVLRFGTTSPDLLDQQAEPGEVIVTSHPPGGDPAFFTYQGSGWIRRDPKPSDHHVWRAGAWMPLDGSLIAEQGRAWEQVKQLRETAIFGTFVWEGFTFQCDEASRARLLEQFAMAAIDPEYSVLWVLADDTKIELEAPHLQELQLALNNHTQNARRIADDARALIRAAATSSAVDAALAWAFGAWGQKEP